MMSIEWYWVAIFILMLCAVLDLAVGVSNDAVNFLNSSFGSRVAPRHIVMAIAGFGIICGVLFSNGMMEIARKGIFNPWLFTMPELVTMFLAVMITDVLLLDLFNSYGMPTSTTVSIVFELLGAAIAAALIKVYFQSDGMDHVLAYINTSKALVIVFGILLSIVVAFFSGAVVQFVTRLVFSFDYQPNMKRFGAIWGGIALSVIVFFILIKGAKGTTFISEESLLFINTHKLVILACIFLVTTILSQFLISFLHLNIFKPIVLIGTFALAMAFAANDLVNFIGVPLAGLHAVKTAFASTDPLNIPMTALSGAVQSETIYLFIAGVVMVLALSFSKKAQTVTETEISLGKQEEGIERFESVFLSRAIVRMGFAVINTIKTWIPDAVLRAARKRLTPLDPSTQTPAQSQPAFDLVRASVNLVVASAVISYATSMKLPLSTTYVTFMVAMGTSFSDRAWGSESAVYRVTGVLMVIGGWFMTALIAFSVSLIFTMIIHHFQGFGTIALILMVLLIIRKTHRQHKNRVEQKEETAIFAMEEVGDASKAIDTTFNQTRYFLEEMQHSLETAFDALFSGNIVQLRHEKNRVKRFQVWVNAIISNIFRTLRVLHREDEGRSFRYAQSIRRLQKLSDAYRDIVLRSYVHINNQHDRFSKEQQGELEKIKSILIQILEEGANAFQQHAAKPLDRLQELSIQLEAISYQLDRIQIERIRYHASRTKLSVLYYAIIGDAKVICRQITRLMKIYNESFPPKDEIDAESN